MKSILTITALLCCVVPGTIEYYGTDRDFSFYMNEAARVEKQPAESGYMEQFYIYGTTEQTKTLVQYFVIVNKQTKFKDMTQAGLYTDAYRDNFLKTCNCELISSKKMQYEHLEGIRFKIKSGIADGMIGYSISTMKGTNIYSIIFLTPEALMPRYESEFTALMNTMKIYK